MSMPLEDGLNLILKAFENDRKDNCFKMYVFERLFMDEPMNFEQYYKAMTRIVKKESKEEIYLKVNSILRKTAKKGGESNGDI